MGLRNPAGLLPRSWCRVLAKVSGEISAARTDRIKPLANDVTL
jgi:hypothetical protein